MGKLNKEYRNEDLRLHVSPFHDRYKVSEKENAIYIQTPNCNIGFTIKEAKELIPILQEIVEAVEYEPVIGDAITITDGLFKGMTGRIYDIDEAAKERELVIKMDKTLYNDTFYTYIDKDNVE